VSRVFWDTNLFIYLFEGSGELAAKVAEMRERMLSRADQLFTSTLTLGEILVKPLEARNYEIAKRYQEILTKTCTLISFDQKEALRYGEMRLDRTLRAPDAIQLSCAASAGIDLFITNDARLSQRSVPEIQFITSLANSPL
jgi:predicted nucleic acid-binding protein